MPIQPTPTESPKLRDILTAFALLTRIPVRAQFDRTAQAVWAFPMVGLGIGTCVALMASLASWFGVGANISAGLALAFGIILTGAMHEDGIADSADGLWGGWEKARRLEIMRDSQIGTYGVLALVLTMLLRFSALSHLIGASNIIAPLVIAHVLSRAAIPYVMVLLPHARSDGLSVQTGRPSMYVATIGSLLAIGMAWIFAGFVPMLFALIAVACSTCAVIAIARAKIGGQTGDILGASQVLSELGVLIVFIALL